MITKTSTIQIPYLDLITPPTIEPVTLTEAKNVLRVDCNEEDELIISIIRAAREAAENYLRRSLITQTWQLQYDHYAPSTIILPKAPVQNIVAVKIIDSEWNETILSSNAYHLSAGKERLAFDVLPMGMVVQIRYVTGYGGLDDVPAQIKQGILAHIVAMYENRTGGFELTEAVKSLYAPYKIIKI